jgi:hypothetical protein
MRNKDMGTAMNYWHPQVEVVRAALNHLQKSAEQSVGNRF